MTTEIITINPVSIAQNLNFKDPRLQEATTRIAEIYSDAAHYADSRNREISRILSDVSKAKAYEKDGFKSVADYASQVFGIQRQNAYALASAGSIYNDEEVNDTIKSMSPSKLAEISKLDKDTLNKAVETGEITPDMTQKQLREVAKAHTEKKNSPKVEYQYTARPLTTVISDEFLFNPKLMEDWDEYFVSYVESMYPESPVEIIKLPATTVNPGDKKATIARKLYINRGFSVAVEFTTCTQPKNHKKQSKHKYTVEELKAMLAEAEEEG